MNKLLTISIAAYNVEKYIDQTLKSICCEKIMPYIEVFVIDDGGKDRTIDIARQYAEKYPDSIFPIHKENGGWGSTVNYSIQNASGKYFKLLDGDDYFNTDGLIELINVLKDIDADIIFTPYTRFDDATGRVIAHFSVGNNMILEKKIDMMSVSDEIDFAMHSSTFKTSLLQDNKVNILEHCFYTDNEYRTKAVAYAQSALFLNTDVYQYRVGREGQSVDLSGLKKHYKDSRRVVEEMISFCKKVNDLPTYNKVLNYTHNAISFCYEALIRLGYKTELKEYDEYLKQQGNEFYKINNAMIYKMRNKEFENLSIFTKYYNLRNDLVRRIRLMAQKIKS